METNGKPTWLRSAKCVLQLHRCSGTKGNVIIVVLLSFPISKAKAKYKRLLFLQERAGRGERRRSHRKPTSGLFLKPGQLMHPIKAI